MGDVGVVQAQAWQGQLDPFTWTPSPGAKHAQPDRRGATRGRVRGNPDGLFQGLLAAVEVVHDRERPAQQRQTS
jgi:hypothetical protein